MTENKQRNTKIRVLNILVPLFLTLAGVFCVLEFGFRYFYQLIPLDVCASSSIIGNYYCQPYFQYDKPIRLAYHYKPGYSTEGWWDPANPNMANAADETAPTDRSDAFWYVFKTDDMGFPNEQSHWSGQYDMVIAGDSFTIRTAPKTWIELLQESSGLSALTLGAPSWSTSNETEAIKMYGLDKNPSWVLLMFFEGNDLFNTAQYIERQQSGLSWKEFDMRSASLGEKLVTPHLFKYWIGKWFTQDDSQSKRYRYPVTASTKAGDIQMVLKDIHLLPLSAGYETLAHSDEFSYTKQLLIDLNRQCQAQGARLLIVYIPSKEHVYWSRIWDSTDVNNILERTVTVTLSDGDHGSLQWETKYLSYQEFQQNHNAQEQLFEQTAQQEQFEFLNLTPIFWDQAIKQGELYHYADPHWNQAGNELAAQAILEYIETH